MKFATWLVPFLLLGCGGAESGEIGVTGRPDSRGKGEESQTPLKVTTDDETVLQPLEEGDEDLLTASLVWDTETGRCRIREGLNAEHAIANFIQAEGAVSLFGVLPWVLTLPKGVDASERVAPNEKYTFFLENEDEDIKLRVVFSYQGTIVNLHKVSYEN